ncbi:hypothetical protein LOTGIDRAFT_170303 [Lottia gigantea]|uniref:Uncharacterized protein n=1 Tax=Lottia gigantea TaxID=225164 RepID=V3ZMU2_LOTGI|nr:hypothetical protein LOTGIDRAFT_170303 [Lottia gigantea]ESO82156.1 hypothetical protein LOTGIDRAFT_170303 [Lottia gigantea]
MKERHTLGLHFPLNESRNITNLQKIYKTNCGIAKPKIEHMVARSKFKMLKLIVTALILTMVFFQADGAAFIFDMKREINDDGQIINYCEFEGERHEYGETWIKDCVKCDCIGRYMDCSTMGYYLASPTFENCSIVHLDNCCYQYYKDDDPTVPCTEEICH